MQEGGAPNIKQEIVSLITDYLRIGRVNEMLMVWHWLYLYKIK